jgi:tRNA threonylcarbamoyladenosine biosynthesis protein TsaB
MSGNWLLIETSGRVGRVGLAANGTTRAADLDATRRHARDLTLTVENLLTAAELRVADLTGVMVSRGPGSYTGLRVGIMSAKAFAYATGCHFVAVDTFAAIAHQAPPEAERLCVIADALQGQVYLQQFERGVAVDELRIESAAEVLPSLAAGTWVSGPGVKVHADRIPSGCSLVAEADREPRVESLFAVGSRRTPATREELFALEPLYLRGSSAEEKRK